MRKVIKKIGFIHCNLEAWNALNKEIKKLNPSSIFVITDSNTMTHCLPLFLENYKHPLSPEILTIQEGEQHKNMQTCLTIWNELTEKGADRNSLIINLGGGVITDLGGFVACTFKRGLNFINIPTSLLAMVDASVGGKNGVDLEMIKNQIGVITNPNLVIIDTQFLTTLDNRQKTSGYAEMLKHGLIHSKEYWKQIKTFDETAFKLKSDSELERAYFLFKMIANEPLVRIGTAATKFALNLHLPVEGLIRSTVFDHFCGGVNEKDCMPVVDNLFDCIQI